MDWAAAMRSVGMVSSTRQSPFVPECAALNDTVSTDTCELVTLIPVRNSEKYKLHCVFLQYSPKYVFQKYTLKVV